jgi:hypothetical protein
MTKRIMHIPITIGTGKNNNTKFHVVDFCVVVKRKDNKQREYGRETVAV